jgi:hypothetical protein
MSIQELAEALDNLNRQWKQGLLTEREYVVNVYRFMIIFDAKNA